MNDISQLPKSVMSLHNLDQTPIKEPLPLIRPMEEAYDYPVDQLGEQLAALVKEVAFNVQVSPAIVAHSVLATCSLLAQPHVNIEMNGSVYPASLFLITIAESGDRKSAADRLILHKITEYEKEALCKYQQEKKAYKKALEKNNTQKKSKKPPEEDLPHEPINPLILVQEPTYEGLIKHLAKENAYLGLFSDEGGRMLAGHSMGNEQALKTIAGLSELWDGSPVSRMRAGDTTEKLYDKRLSLHLMVQNIVSKKLFSDSLFKEQGFLARILAWAPKSLAGFRIYKDTNIYELQEVIKFHKQVEDLLNLWKNILPHKNSKPRTVPLSQKAKIILSHFHDEVERKLAPQKEFATIRPFAGKMPQMAIRLAVVLNFFDDPQLQEITEEWMLRGCEIGRAYLNETRRLWGIVDSDSHLLDAEKVRLWLINHWAPKHNSQITRSQLYQRGPTVVRSARQAKKIIAILEEHGWLYVLDDHSQTLAIITGADHHDEKA